MMKAESLPLYATIFADRALRTRYQRVAKWRAGLEAELATLRADAHAAEAAGRDAESHVLRSMYDELSRPLVGLHLEGVAENAEHTSGHRAPQR